MNYVIAKVYIPSECTMETYRDWCALTMEKLEIDLGEIELILDQEFMMDEECDEEPE